MFLGFMLLFGAIIAWAVAIMMSPHGEVVGVTGEPVKHGVVVFMLKSALGTLILSALSGYLLFPARRPVQPRRDWAIRAVLAVMVLSTLYQLGWLYFSVMR
jgi:hypothetical protein